MASPDPTFKVGDSFGSYDELRKAIQEFQNFHYVKFWKREARTCSMSKKSRPGRGVICGSYYHSSDGDGALQCELEEASR
jgi:hypothetical protein